MRIIVTGQRSYGSAVLDRLCDDGHEIAEVWAPGPEDPVAATAQRRGLSWRNGPTTADWVASLEADVIVAAHSHAFIGKRTRAATRLGAVGYHPSLLPRHRGRDAVIWTVRMLDAVAGGSVYWFTDNVDGGPIAAQDWCFVRPDWTPSDLWRERLFPMGVRLTSEVLANLEAGRIVAVPQDESVATWEPSWDRPPLFRPELPELGEVAGFETVARLEVAR